MRTLTADQQRVKDLVEVFDTPIVLNPGGWEDTLPEWLRLRVIKERVEMVCNGGWDKATNAEVTCYLYTAALAQPLGSDWTEITLYQAAEQMPQLREALPATPKELSDYQKHELGDLKRKIRDSQIRRRKSKRKETDMGKRKLVLEEHDNSVLVGIMQDGCDPFIKTTEGGLDEALASIPGFLTEAQEKWAVQPKNPAYKAPAPAKPAKAAPKPAAAATPTQPEKAKDLPLLAGTETAKPAEAPVEEQAPKPEEQAPAPAEEPAEEPAEAPAEEKVAEAEAEVTEPPAAPAAVEPEAEVPPAETEVIEPVEAGVAEDKAEAELSERIAQTPAPQPAKPGEWAYYLQDGRGPFESVQAAMDELGLDKNTRPTHNRWDRLSTALKEKIQRRPKA